MNKLWIGVLVALLLCAGCSTDFDNLEYENWKPIAAIPLVSSQITIDDVLTELNHPEDVLILEDGTVALNYKGELVSFTPGDVLGLPDQQVAESFQIGSAEATAIDNSGGIEIEIPLSVPLDIEVDPLDIRLDEMVLESGTLELSFLRLQDENLSAELEINQIKDELGNALVLSITGTSAVGVAEISAVDLAGYSLEPVFIPPSTHRVNVDGVLTVSDNDLNAATPGGFVEIELSLADLSFQQVIGDFGNLSLSSDIDTIEVDLFENIQGGQFTLSEAIFNLDVTNSFGIPSLVELGEVVSINQNNGEVTPLFLEDLELAGQQDINGAPETEVFTFDNGNSQVATLFEPAPKLVVFSITTESNPNGAPPPSDPNFMTNESSLDVDVDLILPLQGYAQDLLVFDTIATEIGFEEYENIDSLEFRLFSENSFPLDVAFQAYFLNENATVIDSLFLTDTNIISSALVNAEGEVTVSSEQVSFITLNSERALNLENVTDVMFRAVFNTAESPNEQEVRITSEQTIDIALGIKIFGNIEP